MASKLEKYRLIKPEELKRFGWTFTGGDQDKIRKVKSLIDKHYEKAVAEKAALAVVTFNNEYNDEGYSASVAVIAVFDNQGNSLYPYDLSEWVLACKEESYTFEPTCHSGYGFDEPVAPLTLVLAGESPIELYVKE